jgi:TonB family protein
MDFSFGSPKAESGAPAPGKRMLSLGLPSRGVDDSTPFSLDTDAEVGPDWRNALAAWVEDHSYYPQQAGELGQEGSPRVVITLMPDGRVISVEMDHASASQWLNLGLLGLFRGAKLPPLPKSAGDKPIQIYFTMKYIIPR